MMKVDGLPTLQWLGDRPGTAEVEAAGLKLVAPASSDWFNDPMGPMRNSSAPAAVFRPKGDFQLAARVTVQFSTVFDAAVLFVHQSDNDYAKLCFEYAPNQIPMVLSVVTREVSDDANGPAIDGSTVWLRISRIGSAWAFHHSLDGKTWLMTRLFALRGRAADAAVGFLAQSPTGTSCAVTFEEVTFRAATLSDVRDGS